MATVGDSSGQLKLLRAKGFSPSRLKELGIRALCFVCALISVITTIGILYVLVKESYGFFQAVSPVDFYTGKEWSPQFEPPKFGILPLLCGTMLITVGSGLISIPLGLLSAIYLAEYANPKVKRLLKPALEMLAGIPTVVYGYFALFFVTPLLQRMSSGFEVYNAASGAIVVGIMTLPLVSSLCEDSISAVPRSIREGAYALGATKFEVTVKTVIPAALSGIVASFILALSRAVGETMAVTLAAGATPTLTLNPARQIETMTAYIVSVSSGDAPVGSLEYKTIFAVGITLFLLTLLANLVAARLVRRFRRVYA